MSSKQLVEFFFTPVEPGLFCCNMYQQPRKQPPRTGCTNLLSHPHAKHPTHGEYYAELHRCNLTSLDVFEFVDQDTSNMFDWMRWVVERNQALDEVENPLTQQLAKMRPVSVERLKSYCAA